MLALWLLAATQAVALLVLMARLAPGRRRRPPVPPVADANAPETSLTITVATLNEAKRIGPCLEGLMRQGPIAKEILVVDSRSTDGTRELVEAAARRDPRIRLLTDEPLPPDWVGKVWALQHGLAHATGEWVLGIDADITPVPGLASGVVAAALEQRFDVVSFSPRFTIPTAAEQWLQPALLVTLVYRCGAAGEGTPDPERVLANGQCFLAKRSVLNAHGGYAAAQRSFADDVTLARHMARAGVRVGFLDGSSIYRVRSYSSMSEAWREWGRSLDLKDATTPARQWADVSFLFLAQALPLPMVVVLLAMGRAAVGAPWQPLLVVNGMLLGIRLMLLAALKASYDAPSLPFWLSPLADIPAAVRILLSTLRTRRTWRGRAYAPLPNS